jgi:hypothetical protein
LCRKRPTARLFWSFRLRHTIILFAAASFAGCSANSRLCLGVDIMGLHDLLFPLHARRRLARLATTVGRRSLPLAAAAVGNRMFSMTLPEARGYVRARARTAILAEVDALSAAGQSLSPATSHQLVELALEQVVVRMIAQRVVEEPAALPGRRAA